MRIPHELREEVPSEVRFIDRLIKTNREFRQLTGQYDGINRRIQSMESEDDPTSDEVLEKIKKQRLKLKDELATMLTEC